MERTRIKITGIIVPLFFVILGGLLPVAVSEGLGEMGAGYASPVRILEPVAGSAAELTFRATSDFEQWLVVLSSFAVKPLYMLLSLVVIAIIFFSRARDLTVLKWSMIAFFVGEALCTVNYIVFNDESYLIEYLHGYGMVLSFGLCVWAIMEGMDRRVVRISDRGKKCAWVGLCRQCWKYSPVNCSMRRVFLFFLPIFIGLALIPLTVRLQDSTYRSIIFNSNYIFRHDLWNQWFEIRFAPALALIFFLVAFVIGFTERPLLSRPGQILFAFGIGYLGFGCFRMIIHGLFLERLSWFIVWEEVTELFFILGVLMIILMFRKKLLIGSRSQNRL